MIAERFPDLEKLDPEDQLILAGELWCRATTDCRGMSPDLPEDVVRRIEQRLEAYLERPDSGIRWEDLKRKPEGE